MIKSVLSEYDLRVGDVTSFTTDNGANIKSAIKSLEVTRVPCFGHVLHDAINKAIDGENEINEMLKDCRAIVSTMHHSFK